VVKRIVADRSLLVRRLSGHSLLTYQPVQTLDGNSSLGPAERRPLLLISKSLLAFLSIMLQQLSYGRQRSVS